MIIFLSTMTMIISWMLAIKFKKILDIHNALLATDTDVTVNPGQMPGFIRLIVRSTRQTSTIALYCRYSHVVILTTWVYIYTTYIQPFSNINMIRLEVILAIGVSGLIMILVDVRRWKLIPINIEKL